MAALALAVLAPRYALAQDGAEVVERYGCASCHAIPGVQVAREESCVGCHTEIAATTRRGLGSGPRVETYLHAPDLSRVTRRVTDDYLVRFIRDPHDVRPRLAESMPRLPVSARDARAIVGYLRAAAPEGDFEGPTAAPGLDGGRVARGREVFVTSCAGCHAFGNVDPGYELPPAAQHALGASLVLAPNLRFVRDRMTPAVALAWIRNPRAVDPEAHMEKPDIGRDEALAVRDFLFLGDPGRPVPPRALPTARSVEPLDRAVRFPEVRRILGRSCIHCHSRTQSEDAMAGLGFERATLDLATWEGVRQGVVGPDGTGRSVLEPGADGLPPLVARLLHRHAEARRDVVEPLADPLTPAFRVTRDDAPAGMPLGLPPVSIDDIRVIATWIERGAPR
jgi:cytochrome c5